VTIAKKKYIYKKLFRIKYLITLIILISFININIFRHCMSVSVSSITRVPIYAIQSDTTEREFQLIYYSIKMLDWGILQANGLFVFCNFLKMSILICKLKEFLMISVGSTLLKLKTFFIRKI